MQRHQVLVITGETGCGKSTQLPKMCLDAGRGTAGIIGCTQPRRIAAVTIARRLAEELGEEIGGSVAYKIRFDEKSGADPYIKLMTDGVLLMEAQSDRLLRRYDTLIVDEAHERTLNIDFILGLLRTILPRRRDLQVIITSATLDTERFSRAFNNAPIINISGRLYPVEVRWQPLATAEDGEESCSYVEGAAAAVAELACRAGAGAHGDILIFMPSEQDIRDTCELLYGRFGEAKTILPLFSRLSAGEQQRVFQASPRQKIVVATNVAETSLTIPGIRYVIDTGLARISQYNPRTRTASLPVAPISQSSADQRLGRCGRVRDGVCIRLYDRDDYLARPPFTPPEIMRANLAGVVLRMLYLNIGDVFTFPFLDPPSKRHLNDALEILRELGAVSRSDKTELTATGRLMARLPVDPRFARMLIAGQERDCLEEMIVITAALSIVDPRERPQDKLSQAAQMHARFHDPGSDFIGLLKIWRAFQLARGTNSSANSLRKFCRANYLSWRRLREWQDLYRQLQTIIAEAPAAVFQVSKSRTAAAKANDSDASLVKSQSVAPAGDSYASLHKAILSGFLSGIALKKENNLYGAPKGRSAMIFPGSGVFRKGGTWIVAVEWVETSRLYARTVANIEAEWIAEVAGSLCRTVFTDPFWNRERGEVQAFEQVSLFGMVIIPRRVVSYGRIGPDLAREIFIREGIMAGNLKGDYPFLAHNAAVIEKVRLMESKLRTSGLFYNEEAVYDFYRRRLPQMFAERTFRHYIRQQGNDRFLHMETGDILPDAPDPEILEVWPDEMLLYGVSIPLSYNFSPGNQDDGITARIPASLLATPESLQLEWSVPGLVRDRIHELLRLLPKTYRRLLPPGHEPAVALFHDLRDERMPLPEALSKAVKKRYGVSVPVAAWPLKNLPDALKMRFIVTAQNDTELANSRDLPALHTRYFKTAKEESMQHAEILWEKDDLHQWDFGSLPETVILGKPDLPIGTAYPALQVDAGGIHRRLFSSPREAAHHHRRGVAALYEKFFADECKYLKKTLLPSGILKIHAEKFGGTKKVQKLLYDKVIHDLFFVNIRDSISFYNYAQEVKTRILTHGQEVMCLTSPVLAANFQAMEALERLAEQHRRQKSAQEYIDYLRQDLRELLPNDFLTRYPEERIKQLPRYLRGLAIRAERGMFNIAKALLKTGEIIYYRDRWQEMIGIDKSPDSGMPRHEDDDEFFWLIEEYKISLFAQELKTCVPVSPKRLDEKLQAIRKNIAAKKI